MFWKNVEEKSSAFSIFKCPCPETNLENIGLPDRPTLKMTAAFSWNQQRRITDGWNQRFGKRWSRSWLEVGQSTSHIVTWDRYHQCGWRYSSYRWNRRPQNPIDFVNPIHTRVNHVWIMMHYQSWCLCVRNIGIFRRSRNVKNDLPNPFEPPETYNLHQSTSLYSVLRAYQRSVCIATAHLPDVACKAQSAMVSRGVSHYDIWKQFYLLFNHGVHVRCAHKFIYD